MRQQVDVYLLASLCVQASECACVQVHCMRAVCALPANQHRSDTSTRDASARTQTRTNGGARSHAHLASRDSKGEALRQEVRESKSLTTVFEALCLQILPRECKKRVLCRNLSLASGASNGGQLPLRPCELCCRGPSTGTEGKGRREGGKEGRGKEGRKEGKERNIIGENEHGCTGLARH